MFPVKARVHSAAELTAIRIRRPRRPVGARYNSAAGGEKLMPRRIPCRSLALIAASAFFCASPSVSAQWLKYPSAGIPRSRDGKVSLTAPAPRTRDGRPDFSGMWMTGNPVPCQRGPGADFLECGIELPISKEGINIGVSLPGGLPYQPWAAEQVKKETAENAKDDPHARCMPDTFLRLYGLPHMQKFVQARSLLVILDELNASYRQVFTDGRPLPIDPQPSWNGYSSGKWVGDTLVVDTIGFRDGLWLDISGSPMTDAAKVRERIRRPDFGHLDIEVTVEDSKAYTRPWTVTLKQAIVVDTELVDEICLENEKSVQRMTGK
jgi:hypothetical protein